MIIRKMRSGVKHILDYIYSIYFNFKVFPISIAKKLPIKVNYKMDLVKCHKGCIEIKGSIHRNMIKLGAVGAPFIRKENTSFYCAESGTLIFNGEAVLAEGIKIFIENGTVTIGNNSYIGCNTAIQCKKGITIGNNFLGGWNLCIRDTDGHQIKKDGKLLEMNKEVEIDDNVWIASDCTILKGSKITQGSIVGCNSLVCGFRMDKSHCILAGSPAKITRENIEWIE
ncbi:acyltransferase [Intestinibacter bartlettii]|uniref:acyltransferase n=1 Tax=Intestinibacter bartlettii TaxID=261299 RepID=UPI0022E3CBEF|nr:acyltransferase [Intestinibacter bartlettii]